MRTCNFSCSSSSKLVCFSRCRVLRTCICSLAVAIGACASVTYMHVNVWTLAYAYLHVYTQVHLRYKNTQVQQWTHKLTYSRTYKLTSSRLSPPFTGRHFPPGRTCTAPTEAIRWQNTAHKIGRGCQAPGERQELKQDFV